MCQWLFKVNRSSHLPVYPSLSSHRVNTTHWAWCRIKVTVLDPAKSQNLLQWVLQTSPCHWLNHYIIQIQLHPDGLVAVQDSDCTKQGPLLCCKVPGSCKEHRCPVHNCITSPPSWQGFQHTGVGAPTVLFLSIWSSSPLCKQLSHTVLVYISIKPILFMAQALGCHCGTLPQGQTHIWQSCSVVTTSLHLHQNKLKQVTPSCLLILQPQSSLMQKF